MTAGLDSDLDLITDMGRDALLPVQFFASGRTGGASRPVLELMRGVLREAVLTYQRSAGRHRPRERRLFAEADEWFAARDQRGPFAFATICDVLGLDATRFHDGLRAWHARRMLARRPATARRRPRIIRDGGVRRASGTAAGRRRAAARQRAAAGMALESGAARV